MKNVHNTNLDLNLVPIFDAIYREKSVGKAAEQLGLSQSNMSHSLRRLRDFFEDPLFIKTGDGMRPTPKAEDLSQTMLEIVKLIQKDLLTASSFDPKKSHRIFNLCMTDMGELVFLPPLISKLRQEAPYCAIRSMQLRPKNIPDALESGEIDLAIGSILAMPEGLFQQQLFTHPFVTIVSTKNKSIGKSMTVEQFFDMEHISVALAEKVDGYYDSAIDELSRKRKIFLTTPHFLTVPLIIEKNPFLIATVPRELGTIFSSYKTIRVIPTPIQVPRVALRQHWHPRFHHDEANTWLRKLVKDTFVGYPE
jgi:DNA-binding transcriptional LysR family regulator